MTCNSAVQGLKFFQSVKDLFNMALQDAAIKLLTRDGIDRLNAIIFDLFPRFGKASKEGFILKQSDSLTDFPQVICKLKNLQDLEFGFQGIHSIPVSIANIKPLYYLKLNNCPLLETLPASIGDLSMHRIYLTECPSLKTPPREIVDQGSKAVVAYLRRLQSGSVTCKRTKLMFVGLGGAGKTRYVSAEYFK